ncbi:DUF2255 family protein [Actinacidiphila acidipaludis]|uniref:DUF2255 family protein n=1 Tax=Actinacidiphila acidipaludis TaxID=2873382 RepID=A0ABS7QDS1_9ACTN|nr:DUF2255 family protein [Streptomyces acidipaludis]MBY8881317.1 DUF2255 family protein [Streptomyces acidipaludis]
MTAWTAAELDRISGSDELDVAPLDSDGDLRPPTTIWVVRDGDELYVRSWRGQGGVWYQAARSSHAGRITSGDIAKDVTFTEERDPVVNQRLDAAYRSKYSRYTSYVAPMVADSARAATLKVQPR